MTSVRMSIVAGYFSMMRSAPAIVEPPDINVTSCALCVALATSSARFRYCGGTLHQAIDHSGTKWCRVRRSNIPLGRTRSDCRLINALREARATSSGLSTGSQDGVVGRLVRFLVQYSVSTAEAATSVAVSFVPLRSGSHCFVKSAHAPAGGSTARSRAATEGRPR